MNQIPFEPSAVEQFLNNKMEHYIELHKSMVEINSFTSNPEGVNALGRLTAKLFQPLGFKVEFVRSDQADFGQHLFLSKKPSGETTKSLSKTIAFVSHLDTVFPPQEEIEHQFFWRRENKRIYGPGAVDIKGGTVLIYMLFDVLQRFAAEVFSQHTWIVGLNASEERLSEDFTKAFRSYLPEDTLACLVFEGGNISGEAFQLVTARKGRAHFRVNVQGRSAHAGNNHSSGANAIVQMSQTIQKIASLTEYSRDLTFNVGTVSGGVVVNRVPHIAEAEVEMRTFSPDVFEEGIKQMSALEGDGEVASQDGYSCNVKIDLLDRSEPWPENPKTENLYLHWEKAARSIGMQVVREQRGGLSDGNFLWKDYPTLDGLGPAGNYSHCSERDLAAGKDQEYVSLPSFVPKTLLNMMAVTTLLEA
jgi:glutamate carboxypeptidase